MRLIIEMQERHYFKMQELESFDQRKNQESRNKNSTLDPGTSSNLLEVENLFEVDNIRTRPEFCLLKKLEMHIMRNLKCIIVAHT